MTQITETTSNQKLTTVLTAPNNEAMVKVRIPANTLSGSMPLLRSRSAPINKPIPRATAKLSQSALSNMTIFSIDLVYNKPRSTNEKVVLPATIK